jgi:hypothetical protein
MKMREFIECPNDDCDSFARWDGGDQEYSCGKCDARLAKVVTPNEEEDSR